ncbi:9-O-acetylesterase [bacterium]|nr:9-O-acetylesterase [bacterium]
MGGRRLLTGFAAAAILILHCSVFQTENQHQIQSTSMVRIPNLFSDHMVLQQNQPIPVWGTAGPGETVTVRLGYQKNETRADGSGSWSLELPAMKAGGPFEMVVLGRNVIRLQDIYIGEVWICSGQSNMEMQLMQVRDAELEIENSHYPEIRLLTVGHNVSYRPVPDIATEGWKICSPRTSGEFSAVGYFFGRMLHEQLRIPVGLIQSAWGGTVAEAWMSRQALQQFSEFDAFFQQMDSLSQAPSYQEIQNTQEQALQQWVDTVNGLDQGRPADGHGWEDPAMMVDEWKTAELPGLWENSDIGDYDGIVWYRKVVEIPDSMDRESWMLNLGVIDDIDETWVNGVPVGGMQIYNRKREYPIPAHVIHPGINVIAVRVTDHHGGGGFWGNPEDMALKSGEDVRLPLAGKWRYRVGIPAKDLPPVPREVVGMENDPTGLFNAMIHPLVPYGIRGVIWYQGESNAGRAWQYRTLFPALIRDWRMQWKQDFPFLFVQLANYMAVRPAPSESDWAELREAQAMALSVPETGMAVIIDIGEAEDIHPKNKQDVGKRLALNALARVYDEDVVYSGPVYRSMDTEGGKIRLFFDHVHKGLLAKGGRLTGFAIAGEDRKFVWADAEIMDDGSILVSGVSVPKPVAVRYGWANNPECNLYNRDGLPASPFRTDDWPGMTWPDAMK